MTRPQMIAAICAWWKDRPFWRSERRRVYEARCEPLPDVLLYGPADAARTAADYRLDAGSGVG